MKKSKGKKRRKAPCFKPPVHYLVKVGYSREAALQLLHGPRLASAGEAMDGAKRAEPRMETPQESIDRLNKSLSLAQARSEASNIAYRSALEIVAGARR